MIICQILSKSSWIPQFKFENQKSVAICRIERFSCFVVAIWSNFVLLSLLTIIIYRRSHLQTHTDYILHLKRNFNWLPGLKTKWQSVDNIVLIISLLFFTIFILSCIGMRKLAFIPSQTVILDKFKLLPVDGAWSEFGRKHCEQKDQRSCSVFGNTNQVMKACLTAFNDTYFL